MNLTSINRCAEALSQLTSLPTVITRQDVSRTATGLMLTLDARYQFPLYWFESIAGPEQWGEVANSDGILCTAHLSASQAKRLKAMHVQYLDQDGNAYIRQPNLFVFIRGINRADKKITTKQDKTKKTGKAFQPSGLKVLYALLAEPQLVSASMRGIAKHAGVALGSVGAVMNDLAAHGYLATVDADMHLVNREQLIQRWAELYPYSLRDKAHLGRFTAADRNWWQQLKTDINYQLSGEIAAEKITDYLNSKDAVVYIDREQLPVLLNAGRLRKLKEDERPEFFVDLYEPFWQANPADKIAPALIIYSDLLSTNDPRNEDAARRIFDVCIR